MSYIGRIGEIACTDVEELNRKDKEYGGSWLRRGGVGAWMMAARKIDRLEVAVKVVQYDIFEAIRRDQRPEGILDDIRDLRRYLLLIEAEALERAQRGDGMEHPFGFDAQDETSSV